jgi:hypothetical protein
MVLPPPRTEPATPPTTAPVAVLFSRLVIWPQAPNDIADVAMIETKIKRLLMIVRPFAK